MRSSKSCRFHSKPVVSEYIHLSLHGFREVYVSVWVKTLLKAYVLLSRISLSIFKVEASDRMQNFQRNTQTHTHTFFSACISCFLPFRRAFHMQQQQHTLAEKHYYYNRMRERRPIVVFDTYKTCGARWCALFVLFSFADKHTRTPEHAVRQQRAEPVLNMQPRHRWKAETIVRCINGICRYFSIFFFFVGPPCKPFFTMLMPHTPCPIHMNVCWGFATFA